MLSQKALIDAGVVGAFEAVTNALVNSNLPDYEKAHFALLLKEQVLRREKITQSVEDKLEDILFANIAKALDNT